jgi:hypothetical protein
VLKLLVGIVAVAVVATLGDWVWYEFGVRNRVLTGVVHGAALLMAAGGALAWSHGRIGIGLVIGIGAGVIGALAYYALDLVMGRAAVLAAWVCVWLLLAVGQGRVVQRPPRAWNAVVMAGIAAALLSSLTFYAVSGIVWGRPPADGRNYALQLACWLLAWAPGLLAIGAGTRSRTPL